MQDKAPNPKDGVQLISDLPGKHDNPHALLFFLLLHFSYLFIILFINGLNLYVKGAIILVLILIALYFTNTHFSWTLVGIQLKIEKKKSFPSVSILSRSLPFVASTINSNSFWLTLFASTILLFFISIYHIFSPSKVYGILLLIGFIAHSVNLHFYVRGHNEAKDEADAAARSMLLDATVAFQTVDKNLSDDEDEKKPNTIEEQQQKIAISMHRSGSTHMNSDSQKIQVPPQFAGKPVSQQSHPIPLPPQTQQITQPIQQNQQQQDVPQPVQQIQQHLQQESEQLQHPQAFDVPTTTTNITEINTNTNQVIQKEEEKPQINDTKPEVVVQNEQEQPANNEAEQSLETNFQPAFDENVDKQKEPENVQTNNGFGAFPSFEETSFEPNFDNQKEPETKKSNNDDFGSFPSFETNFNEQHEPEKEKTNNDFGSFPAFEETTFEPNGKQQKPDQHSPAKNDDGFGSFPTFENSSFPAAFPSFDQDSKPAFGEAQNDAPLFGAAGDGPLFGTAPDDNDDSDDNSNVEEESNGAFKDDDESSSEGFMAFD